MISGFFNSTAMSGHVYTTLSRMPALYEHNYRQLMTLFPDLLRLQHGCTLDIGGHGHLAVEVIKQCRYTTILRLSHGFGIAEHLLRAVEMSVRLYHDARVAEVIHYQRQGGFKAVNDYPNSKMHQRFEKSQINLFLRDWLQHASRHRRRNATRAQRIPE